MSDIVLEFDHVWKKFKKGERFDSLRDLFPAMAKNLFNGMPKDELDKKEFWAIRDVSFQVRKGEALGIIGPNGAGKSTMLKLLSKILRPNKGLINTKGRLSALIEVGAGFHPDLTGRENIYLNGAILGMKKHEIDNKLDEIIAFSELEDFVDTPVKRYSSGMYARLGFSVAAHVNPEILLVDEVLSVGDMKFQQKCLERMREIVNKGITVIFVSHNLESVQTLCPQTLYLQRGQIMQLGNTSEVIKEYFSSSTSSNDSPQWAAQINDVRLYNEKGEAVSAFKPEDKAHLRFALKSQVPLEQCLLGFVVHRADGLPVCDYNLSLNHISGKTLADNGVPITLSFNANLLRGAYIISLHVLNHSKAQKICILRNASFFSVDERISWQGVAHLSPAVI